MSSDFETLLQKYADVTVQVGLDLKAGQHLFITASIDAQPLTQAVVRSAFRAGARDVFVNWTDQTLEKIRLKDGIEDSIEQFPEWMITAIVQHLDDGDAYLNIGATDPDLLAGQDPDRLKIRQLARAKAFHAMSDRIMNNISNWCGIDAPHPAISTKMFPESPLEEAIARHWDGIFAACRVYADDPVTVWKAHIADLNARSDYLNNKAYYALHYKAPGTDLTVGLPQGHIWVAAGQEMKNGTKPVVNLPTEEVFTLAHSDQIHGVVSSTKPLPYNGTIIDKFTLQFSEGVVVSATAEGGGNMLDGILATDEGARSIGELALVPHSSPISQSGLTFYSVLYDENASSHIALGRAYRFTLEGGTEMSSEDFADSGGNNSLVHVDFMVGSEDMDIDGILEDGSREPVMRGGEWAFEV